MQMLRDRAEWHHSYLISMFLKELNFLLREGCHGDGLDSVWWIQSSSVGGEM